MFMCNGRDGNGNLSITHDDINPVFMSWEYLTGVVRFSFRLVKHSCYFALAAGLKSAAPLRDRLLDDKFFSISDVFSSISEFKNSDPDMGDYLNLNVLRITV